MKSGIPENTPASLTEKWTHEAREALSSLSSREGIMSGTGHRPPRLGLSYGSASNRKLTTFALSCINSLEARPSLILSGGAQGWDQALAHAAHIVGIPYWMALPFPCFSTAWPESGRHRFDALCENAERVVVVCDGPHTNWKYFERDKFLVLGAGRVLALFDGKPKSGTGNTVEFAVKVGRPVHNVWEGWCKNH